MKEAQITLRDLLASVVDAMGYEFVGYELLKQNRNSLLRIYIDNEQGITVDDCSKVSHQISAMLDVEDPIKGQYTLEISSPGLDRPLFEIAHYRKFAGNRIKLRVQAPVNGRRNFIGVLIRVEGDNIYLLTETEEVMLPFSNIEKAKVIADRVG
jgi:ribosome maturation factor RimP